MGAAIRIDLTGAMAEYVLGETGEHGTYADPVEYVRDLIRRDMLAERERYEIFKAELRAAFATPIENCIEVTANDVIARNRLDRAA